MHRCSRHGTRLLAEAQAGAISATELALSFLFDQEADLDDYAAIGAILVAATASQVLVLSNGHATMASVGLASAHQGAARPLAAQLMQPPLNERHHTMTVHIGLASQDEILTCARLIAEALHDDPVVHQIVLGNRDRTDRLTELYTAVLRAGAIPHGVIDVARAEPGGPIIGVAAWVGPHRSTTNWRELLQLPRYLRAIGPRRLRAALRALDAFGDLRPSTGYWYLADVAVRPDARGLGVGSALLAHRLRAIDSQGLPAYLEATTPASRRLYERHGFQAAGSIDLAPGVSATTMTRHSTRPV